MAAPPKFAVTLGIKRLKNIPIDDSKVLVVWNAFGFTKQTNTRGVKGSFDQALGNIGVVEWNEEFEIHDVDLTQHQKMSFAIWAYEDSEGKDTPPTPLTIRDLDLEKIMPQKYECTSLFDVPVNICHTSKELKGSLILSMKIENETNKPQAEPQAGPQAQPEAKEASQPAAEQGAATASDKGQGVVTEQAAPPAEAAPPAAAPPAAAATAAAAAAAPAAQAQQAESRRVVNQEVIAEPPPPAVPQYQGEMSKPLNLDELQEKDTSSPAKSANFFAKAFQATCGYPEGFVGEFSEMIGSPPKPLAPSGGSESRQSVVAGLLASGAVVAGELPQAQLNGVLEATLISTYLELLPDGGHRHHQIFGEIAQGMKKLLNLHEGWDAAKCSHSQAARALVSGIVTRSQANTSGQGVIYLPQEMKDWPQFESHVIRVIPNNKFGAMNTDALKELINADSQAGQTPAMIGAYVGYQGSQFSDNLEEICQLASANRLAVHVEGPAQFLLTVQYPSLSPLRKLISERSTSSAPPVTLSLSQDQLLDMGGSNEEVGGRWVLSNWKTEAPMPDFRSTLQFYLDLKELGLGTLKSRVEQRVAQSTVLVKAVSGCDYAELLTQPDNIWSIEFRFKAVEYGNDGNVVDDAKSSRVTELLCKEFVQHYPGTLNVSAITDGSATMRAVHGLVHSNPLTAEGVERLVKRFTHGGGSLQSVVSFSAIASEKLKGIRSIDLRPEISAAYPQALAVFRFSPELYDKIPKEIKVPELNKLNSRMAGLLERMDPAFRLVQWKNDLYTAIAVDEELTLVFDIEKVDQLFEMTENVCKELVRSEEVTSRMNAEITRKAIEAAEKMIKERTEKAEQQSILRLVPIVNWIMPPESDKDSMTFDLGSCKLSINSEGAE